MLVSAAQLRGCKAPHDLRRQPTDLGRRQRGHLDFVQTADRGGRQRRQLSRTQGRQLCCGQLAHVGTGQTAELRGGQCRQLRGAQGRELFLAQFADRGAVQASELGGAQGRQLGDRQTVNRGVAVRTPSCVVVRALTWVVLIPAI